MASEKDILFAGATRPALPLGVTYEALILIISAVGIIFIGTKILWTLLLYFPLHGICYLICLKDPRFFRLLMLWTMTKARSINWRYWGAATAAPQQSTRSKRKMPE
ncbi:VirB3 family type IV secretion system protein [Erwinia amylovora]|uniref:type IV secretion system protein VirB3 n=1 Tax=Erwinia amylovora TaxID=552 RepID=UPI0020BF2720|nr:VirB3 family type IV secretion system protein [Erwinia amylovora]MCK8373816.1 VirB3 family type IV secretion system protein [Erwinia amylovora]